MFFVVENFASASGLLLAKNAQFFLQIFGEKPFIRKAGRRTDNDLEFGEL